MSAIWEKCFAMVLGEEEKRDSEKNGVRGAGRERGGEITFSLVVGIFLFSTLGHVRTSLAKKKLKTF